MLTSMTIHRVQYYAEEAQESTQPQGDPIMIHGPDFQLDETYQLLRQTVRQFCKQHIAPRAHKIDLYRGYGGADVYRLYGNGE